MFYKMGDGVMKKMIVCVVLVIMNFLQVHGLDVNITFIDNAVSKGAVCLDGSPGYYFYDPGFGDGVNNWMVFLMGGGWCHNETDCVKRSLGASGNTTYFPGMLTNEQDINPYFYNWHRIEIGYCDGASFSADVEQVDPKNKLYLRGARIFKAVMDEFLEKGMKNASNAILAGSSAGGLSATLKCDEFQASLPNVPRVKCFSDAGVFFRGENLPGAKELREEYFASVIEFHGLTELLPKSCTSTMDPHLCLFAENLIGDIKTPLFIVQAAFDGWQLTHMVEDQPPNWVNCTTLQLPCTPNQVKVLKEYRNATLEAFEKMGPSTSRGWFIDSCFYHTYTNWGRQRWNGGHMLKNKTVAHAVGDWYFDKSSFQEIAELDFPTDCGHPRHIF